MPLLTATDPPFGPLKRQMNKMMDQMSKGFYSFYPGDTWTPNVNLYETETRYLVCVDLAGVVKEEIDVHVDGQSLILKGTRAVPTKPERREPAGASDGAPGHEQSQEQGQPKYRVHLMEIDHGPFSREVDLPDNVLQDQITATHRNGMLWIELPKKQ